MLEGVASMTTISPFKKWLFKKGYSKTEEAPGLYKRSQRRMNFFGSEQRYTE
jgi:hypothetical protein